MSFGGSAAAMISSLKANAKLLKKKSYYGSVDLDYKESENLNDKFPKATEAQLETIRNNTIKKERRIWMIRILVFVVIFSVGIFYGIRFFN